MSANRFGSIIQVTRHLFQVRASVVRKPPAFTKPVFSDSYLPASMQVIFHTVEQLKRLQIEETQGSNSSIPTTSPHPPGQHQPLSTTMETMIESSTIMTMTMTTNSMPLSSMVETSISHVEIPEVNEENVEMNYATPEVNQEVAEVPHGTTESNYEQPEVDRQTGNESSATTVENDKKKKPSIQSVVEEIYGIVNPSASLISEEGNQESIQSKHSSPTKSVEEIESLEEEDDETRFTLLGEKVVQVPRPSLAGYLRRAKIPPRASLQQLATLYDALSKDARKQGFAKFSGYSNDVLETLVSSAGGGVGPQLKTLLEKTVTKNELTREDSKARTNLVLKELEDSGSVLSTDLRRLVPLRFIP
ncbi:uncharacterized protein LOC107266652 isoform X2 [Cephus cinctus]|uniref:Uncharacterized protein LOC107266652 isoform X2 n=1 Tax=Cephus cinctus TaxID=211228 RepID=A0AAJ7RFN9_CEPCN|nr:uncharacterized protein LOC107266652 isoform X2 [Cephus cinctus]